jgi:hypothetical protein
MSGMMSNLVWTDQTTNQSCYVLAHPGGARLEIRLYGFRVQSYEFPTLADAMCWANHWCPENDASDGRGVTAAILAPADTRADRMASTVLERHLTHDAA